MTKKKNSGFTLLEMMIAVAVFTVVMGAMYSLAFAMGRTSRVQDAKFQATQEARRALIFMIPELLQASRQTIEIGEDDGDTGNIISYQIPEDIDGNGVAVNVNGDLEVSGVRTLQVNEKSQLVLTDSDGNDTVLANNLNPGNEIGTGELLQWTPDDDANGNGRQDLGFLVTRQGNRLLVEVGTLVTTSDGFEAVSEIQQFVTPRNR
jgi:prepilin-type N-terminal cleavage/methylation domain-containing protein